jgi:glycosyltransferase involved in cell wall biosynthesis
MEKILSLTHTNPLIDSRILKTSAVIESLEIPFCVIGINRGKFLSPNRENFVAIDVVTKRRVQLFQKKISKLKTLKRMLSLIVFLEIFLKLFLKGVFFKPTVIHVNDCYVLPIAALIRVFTRSRILYDAHELESETNGISANMRRVVNFIEKSCWNSVDVLVTVSPSIQSWYIQKLGSKSSSIVLNSPHFNVKNIRRQYEDYFREKYNLSKESRIFLYLGNLERGRGIETILEAFLNTPKDRVIIFMGSGSLENKISKFTKNNSNIFLHAPVSHDIVVNVASSADFGICLIEDISLSDRFCLPNKLFEYIFSGLPVIASNLPDMRKLILEYDVGICIENSTQSLLRAVLETDKDQFDDLAFQHDMLNDLSWESQAQKLESIYRELLAVPK